MNIYIIKLVFLTISIIVESNCVTSSYCDCGDWFPYEDEKCFKFFDSMVPQSEAVNICKQSGSILGIVRTQEEQDVVNYNIKSAKIVDNLWLGISKTNNSFEWSDGSKTTYTNWAKGRPLNSTDLDCAVIFQGLIRQSDSVKWLDVNCEKKNAVLCQKLPKWSNDKIQNELLKIRRDHIQDITKQQELIDSQRKQLDNLEKSTISQNNELNSLKSNPVPIGFIYTQFSGQSDPKTLWPNTEWENISEKYSGLFFRVEGGQSSHFGQIQEQQTQSIQVYNDRFSGYNYTFEEWITITETPLKKYILTGHDEGPYFGFNIKHNKAEIRPRNQALRIWQRII